MGRLGHAVGGGSGLGLLELSGDFSVDAGHYDLAAMRAHHPSGHGFVPAVLCALRGHQSAATELRNCAGFWLVRGNGTDRDLYLCGKSPERAGDQPAEYERLQQQPAAVAGLRLCEAPGARCVVYAIAAATLGAKPFRYSPPGSGRVADSDV